MNNGVAIEDQLTPITVEEAAKKNFPICMSECHKKLKKQSHLQYHARQQFRLFLKGCGLTLQHSLEYFRREFCKKTSLSPDEFQKKYAYNIRHSYGKEGKRVDYTPHNCSRIITGTQPMSGQAHGCPFKTFDAKSLRVTLMQDKQRLMKEDVDFIVDAASRKEYQLACRRHFEKAHKGTRAENVGNHPNSWYEESKTHYKKQEEQSSKPKESTEFKISTTL